MSAYYEELKSIEEESLRRMTREESHALHARARQIVSDEFAPEMSPEVQEHIWDKAWEMGHSHGYAEVASEFQDLVIWVRKLQEL